jgi:hypothetical protein
MLSLDQGPWPAPHPSTPALPQKGQAHIGPGPYDKNSLDLFRPGGTGFFSCPVLKIL